jgi:multidrug efflux pump subunit AcrA (membrane-fusion protein)
MPRTSKHVVGYAALVVVLVLTGSMAYGAVAGSGSGAKSNSRTVTAQTGTISQTVSATGNLQPANPTSVNFQTSGTITEIDVSEGEAVTAGEVMAKLDPTQAQADLEVATLNLSAANAKLAQAQAGTSSNAQGSTGNNGNSNGIGGSATVTQAQLQADVVALGDAQQAAQVNAQGYQLAVDQAQAQLAADQPGGDQATITKDQNALADAKQSQAVGTQKDQQAIHAAQAKVDLDKASLAAASAPTNNAATTTVDPATVDQAQASVIQAQTALTSAQKALDATVLTAPVGGTVSDVTKSVGDQVTAGSGSNSSSSSSSSNSSGSGGGGSNNGGNGSNGSNGGSGSNASSSTSSAAFTIVDPTSYEVKVGFPESDAVKVQVGQQAVTTLDALPGTSLTGTVQSVDQTATVTSNVVTYDAIVSVTNAPTTAKSGMTANVTVTTALKANVLELPTAAVQTQGGSSYVNKLVNGQSVQTDVTTGLQGDSTTEITSGLSEGDEVVISTGSVATAASGTGGTGGNGGNGNFRGGGGGGFGGGGGGFGGGGGGFVGGPN